MLKFVLLTVLISLPVLAQNAKLSLNDVSILLPLPPPGQWNLLPSASSIGARGFLLPVNIVAEVPRLISESTNEEIYNRLHAVGIRLDPCFTEGHGPVRCQPQIRMVWQILADNENTTSTIDASLHTFYPVSKEELQQLTEDILKLKTEFSVADDNAALGVHPVIQQQGLGGEYYPRMMQLIYNYVGEQNLSRVTFMTLFMTGNVWEFGGFDIKNSELIPITIPRISSTTQKLVNNALPAEWFRGGLVPAPDGAENLNFLLRDSSKLSLQNEQQIIDAAKAAFKFENPKLHNPGTVDCVSCHAAQPARSFTMLQFPSLQLDQLSREFVYTSARNISNQSPRQSQTNILRSFGYFENSPFVAQRTINESAEVLNYFNQKFK